MKTGKNRHDADRPQPSSRPELETVNKLQPVENSRFRLNLLVVDATSSGGFVLGSINWRYELHHNALVHYVSGASLQTIPKFVTYKHFCINICKSNK